MLNIPQNPKWDIARVMLSLRFINEKLKSKHRSSIYFFLWALAKINLKN